MLQVREAGRARGPVVDFIGQQIVWWGAVALVLTDLAPLALLPALAYVAFRAWHDGLTAMYLALVGAIAGGLVDTALVQLGAISFPSDPSGEGTTPWMVGLWASFAIAFSGSMAWLVRRAAWVAVAFGAVAGVLAYRGGESLGILTIGEGALDLISVARGWAGAVLVIRVAAKECS